MPVEEVRKMHGDQGAGGDRRGIGRVPHERLEGFKRMSGLGDRGPSAARDTTDRRGRVPRRSKMSQGGGGAAEFNAPNKTQRFFNVI